MIVVDREKLDRSDVNAGIMLRGTKNYEIVTIDDSWKENYGEAVEIMAKLKYSHAIMVMFIQDDSDCGTGYTTCLLFTDWLMPNNPSLQTLVDAIFADWYNTACYEGGEEYWLNEPAFYTKNA